MTTKNVDIFNAFSTLPAVSHDFRNLPLYFNERQLVAASKGTCRRENAHPLQPWHIVRPHHLTKSSAANISGKRNTSLAFFTAHERDELRSTWGSQSTRLTRDSFLTFGSCQLCLLPARDPVSCGSDGHLFCRECAVNNLLAQSKELKRLKKEAGPLPEAPETGNDDAGKIPMSTGLRSHLNVPKTLDVLLPPPPPEPVRIEPPLGWPAVRRGLVAVPPEEAERPVSMLLLLRGADSKCIAEGRSKGTRDEILSCPCIRCGSAFATTFFIASIQSRPGTTLDRI